MSSNLILAELEEATASEKQLIRKAAEFIGLGNFGYENSHPSSIYFILPGCYSVAHGILYDTLVTRRCHVYHSGHGKYAIVSKEEVHYTQGQEVSLRIIPEINQKEERVEFHPGIVLEKCNPWSGFLMIFKAWAEPDSKDIR